MQLCITSDYAVRIMFYLGLKAGVVSSSEISETLHISQKYIHNIGRILKQNGFVNTHSGAQGGYSLAKDASEISLYDILSVFETTLKMNRCLESDHYCSRDGAGSCIVHEIYKSAQSALEKSLREDTLATIIKKHNEKFA